jgi:PAS domain S-box-containing protein
MNLIKRLTECGVRSSTDVFQKRTIILTNTVSLTFLFAYILLLICRFVFFGKAFDSQIFGTLFIFACPIIINHFGFAKTAQIFLAWSPVIGIYYNFITVLRSQEVISTTIYDALKIFLVGFSPIPFLILNTSDKKLFFTGISLSILGTVFADQIMDFFEVGPAFVNGMESEIRFNSLRTIISYIAVAGSCFTVRYVVDRADSLNQKLIGELHQKNEIIRKQAESEVNKLNEELFTNLQELRKREIVLKRSQEIAKVGSWEYNVRDKSMFWSEEMYNIFGVDRGFDVKNPNLMKELFNESAFVVENAFLEIESKRISHDLTLQSKTPLGYVKWVRLIGFPLIENDGVTVITGIVHDVTIFKEAEEKIKSNEKNYRSLFEQATDAIMITDLTGKFVDVNTSMCKLLGYEKAELLQQSIAKLIDPQQLKENPIRFKELIEGAHVINERLMMHKDGTLIPVEANVKKFSDNYLMAIARDIRDRKKADHLLNERIKELKTLYGVSQLLSSDTKPTEEVLSEIPDLLPQGWQYPPICVARLSIAGKIYTSQNYRTATDIQKTLIFADQNEIGFVEVGYLEKTPDEYEGPFFLEERNLINTVAEMIQIYLERKHEEEALNKAQANLKATIHNTELLIWSLDYNFEFLTFNDTFANYVKTYYNVIVKEGISHRSFFPEDHCKKWEERYKRVLTGEVVTLEESDNSIDFRISLSPIIQNTRVTGVSAFADNVTEENKKSRQLEEANRKINEHKIMALRSVMNPHFIFNVLSSIQYFITRNDQFNAINYLTSFSKLMRTVLARSVADRIPLKDELEMLQDYVNLEKLRFEEKFEFQIEHDALLDIDGIRIPSLLVQPYVENAILHGLYNKDGIGNLILRTKIKGSYLVFEIEDDGVGRDAASKLNSAKDSTRKSMGTNLTEERLKLINQDSEVAVTYTDLFKEKSPAGTLVQIRIKLEE